MQSLALVIPSGPDLIILAIVVIVLFGARRVPAFLGSIARSHREFRKGLKEDSDHDKT